MLSNEDAHDADRRNQIRVTTVLQADGLYGSGTRLRSIRGLLYKFAINIPVGGPLKIAWYVVSLLGHFANPLYGRVEVELSFAPVLDDTKTDCPNWRLQIREGALVVVRDSHRAFDAFRSKEIHL